MTAADIPSGGVRTLMPRSLVLGVNVSTSAASGADPIGDARRAEVLGFDFISINDHLHGREPTVETWTLLTWLAAATSRIRVATRVLAVPYRWPVVVAKMAESLDRLSQGRLILGLGAGASEEEFAAFGLGTRTPAERIAALEEAIRIIRGVWAQKAFRVEGDHYRALEAEVEPKPVHQIPIWLGTFGKQALRVTGALADGWIPSLAYASPEKAVAMRERVMRAASAAGRDPSAIACIYNLEFRIDPAAEPRPDAVIGSAAAVTARLLGLARLGFTGFNFITAGADREAQLERLAREVVPSLRTAAAAGPRD